MVADESGWTCGDAEATHNRRGTRAAAGSGDDDGGRHRAGDARRQPQPGRRGSEQEGQRQQRAERPDRRAAPGAPLALLLVEDDPTVAEVVAGLLRRQGHAVTHVGNGLAALTEVATAGFDAILLDLDLPGMDGFVLARQLRAQGFERPLIALTARADADAEPLARTAGFDAFLRKPVTAAMLRQLLEPVAPASVAVRAPAPAAAP
ncbi:MAG: response regulator [Proteobacteria bacterium]|nr:response regulator [Pseudomonadota bacterium]